MKNRFLKTKLLAALLTLCMALSLVPVMALAANATVSNETELTAALENTDCAVIKLGGNIEISWHLDVERTVTLDLNGYALTCNTTDMDMIKVSDSGVLTVKDSGNGGIIDGQNKNSGFNVKGGTLILDSGTIANCTEKKINGGGDGGAVDVANVSTAEGTSKPGTFIMNGGVIKNCTAGDDGGAVDIGDAGCTFVMNGGTIESCRAANRGGAVHIREDASFVMNGGLIHDCSAANKGGAVHIYQNGRFTMTGGTMKDCAVDLGGQGNAVYGSNEKAVVALIGGTFENCGVFPYSFDEFTVTFDSDGGTAVTIQKVRNSPAVKPANPKKSGYDFAGWYLGTEEYTFDTKVTENIALKAHWTPAATPSIINEAFIEDVKFNYKAGETPQATATVVASDTDKYEIYYECWGKLDKLDQYTTGTVAYWYSDESWYQDDDVHFNTFDKEGKYQYSVRMKAKDGHTFGDSLSAENITLNGKRLPEGSYVIVLDEGKTCLVSYGTTMRTVRPVEEIRFYGPHTEAFVSGDQPSFAGNCNSAFYDVEYQKWEYKDNSGVGVGSTAVWNENFDQVITNFEYGKTYNYSAYFNITDLGSEEGYRFGENTKLYINDEEITLNSDQVQVYDGGMSIRFKNVLSMTPEAPWQKVNVVEIEGATINFKVGDKPVFTGKVPENTPYVIRQCEFWDGEDGSGVNSAEFWDNNYEKHITAFESGKTYTYGVYVKAEHGYYFTSDTKLKINGTVYNYHLPEGDPELAHPDEMVTLWAITDLTLTPQASGTTPDYKIIEGANSVWTKNTDGTLTFRANGDFSKFTDVKVDGTLLAADKYTVVSGSTVVALNSKYLDTLSVGKHKLTVVYNDGECSTDFEIKAAQGGGDNTTPGKPNNGNNSSNSDKSPKTGDNGNFILCVILLFVSCGVLTGAAIFGKKKRHFAK